jgi:transposase InsO family protein
VRHPQTNGICERFHKTILQEYYQVTFRRKICQSLRSCKPISMNGWRTTTSSRIKERCAAGAPMQTLIDGKEAWHDKITTLNS